MGRAKHTTAINEQDSEPTYQGLIIENGMLTSYKSGIDQQAKGCFREERRSPTQKLVTSTREKIDYRNIIFRSEMGQKLFEPLFGLMWVVYSDCWSY